MIIESTCILNSVFTLISDKNWGVAHLIVLAGSSKAERGLGPGNGEDSRQCCVGVGLDGYFQDFYKLEVNVVISKN